MNFNLTEDSLYKCYVKQMQQYAVLIMLSLCVSTSMCIKILRHFSICIYAVKHAWARDLLIQIAGRTYSLLSLFWDRKVGLDIFSSTPHNFCSTRDLRESLLTGQPLVCRVLLLVIQDKFGFVLEVTRQLSWGSNHILQTFFYLHLKAFIV